MNTSTGNRPSRAVDAATPRAIVYTRISSDREGLEVGVDRQRADCLALAKSIGVEVVQVMTDNDLSASTRSTKPRPAYEEMMVRARRGEFSTIIAYSNSRLTRRVREYMDLIDLHNRHGVTIRTVVSGDHNLATADGRGAALTVAVWDQAEAERTAERVARAKEQTAEQGRYRGGRRPFGFEKDGITQREEEADALRWATEQVIAGRSLAAVARALNEKGITTSSGNQWKHTNLGDLLLRPRNAGLVSKGRRQHTTIVSEKAVWEPIVTREQWQAVQDLLADPSRRTHDSTDTRWMGSGIYRCGRDDCDSPMRTVFVGSTRSRKGPKVRFYRCGTGSHLTIKAEPTDEYVTDTVCAYLGDPRVVAGLSDDSERTRADRARRAALVARLHQTEKDYDEDLIDARRFKAKSDKLQAEIEEIDQRLTVGVQRTAAGRVLNAEDPGEAFRRAPVDVQRAVLRLMVSVTILPAERRGAAWSTDRVLVGPAE